ncbi:MarR family transcriptional regulator [Adhaeribacter swui]|uniref:MarR family transcriptional regulator n=1 Tax=Adhaeribacter swui TaxID=2086471 RepID=A0A7G7G4G9_9BACT|nr:MarR family transcriptional regulator [Adhaeribacter swui]QNF32053.1 MarR family transcriptional regulator [Adhaeribacter swui]
MKLEEEIKQKSFKSPYHRMMVNIMFTGNFLQKRLLCMMREFNISPQQHNVLSILRGQHPNPCSLGDIQERMLDRMSNATRLVDKLLEKDLVVRCQCPNNRRKIEITITNAGLNLLSQIEAKVPSFEELFPAISPEEATTLAQLLDKSRE